METALRRSDGDGKPFPRIALWIFFALVAAGAILRLADLERRPLHGDEAVGALLSHQVKESGSFVYQYSNRHGPFQYLLGGAAMALGGESPFWIRLPFALAGCLLPFCLFPLRRPLGEAGWILCTGLVTFSPLFVYYSRYAIQEIDFAAASALLLACGAAFASRGSGPALLGALLAAGWLVTIKETFIIVFGCAALALLMGSLAGGARFGSALRGAVRSAAGHPRFAAAGILGALLLAGAAYTDFFRDGAGLANLAVNLREMVAAGASGAGAVALHRHPPSFYLSLLARYEWMTLALALAGTVFAFRFRRPLPLFLTLYALLAGGVHLALPYKTPWLLLTPLLPLAILAGYAGGRLLDSPAARRSRLSPFLLLAIILLPLPQTVLLSFVRPADPVAEPLVYHQTGEEQVRMAGDIRAILAKLPAGEGPQAIVCLPYVWPLAWYLRDEPGVLYERKAVPSEPPEVLAHLPLLVTLERADPTFLKVFTGAGTVPPFSLPNHASRTYVLVPPDYVVARLWIRSDLAAPPPAD